MLCASRWWRKLLAMLARTVLLPPCSCLRWTTEPRIAQATRHYLTRASSMSLAGSFTYSFRKPLCCSCSLFQAATIRFFDLSFFLSTKPSSRSFQPHCALFDGTLFVHLVHPVHCGAISDLFFKYSQYPQLIPSSSHLPAHQHNSVPKICHKSSAPVSPSNITAVDKHVFHRPIHLFRLHNHH